MTNFIIDNKNKLWGKGSNEYGQLGIENYENIKKYKLIEFGEKIRHVVVEKYHTLIIDENKNAWVCGYNRYGQFGLNESVGHIIPFFKRVAENIFVEHATSGIAHIIILDDYGNIWGAGSNIHGQLSLKKSKYDIYKKIKFKTSIIQVECGYMYTYIIDENYEIYNCGDNCHGQLSDGTKIDIKEFKRVQIFDKDFINPKQISCGKHHCCIVDNNGELWGAGSNIKGQISMSENRDYLNFSKITFSTSHSSAIKIFCGHNFTSVLDNECTFWFSGALKDYFDSSINIIFKFKMFLSSKTIKYISGNGNSSFIIDEDNNLWVLCNMGQGFIQIFNDINYVSNMSYTKINIKSSI